MSAARRCHWNLCVDEFMSVECGQKTYLNKLRERGEEGTDEGSARSTLCTISSTTSPTMFTVARSFDGWNFSDVLFTGDLDESRIKVVRQHGAARPLQRMMIPSFSPWENTSGPTTEFVAESFWGTD